MRRVASRLASLPLAAGHERGGLPPTRTRPFRELHEQGGRPKLDEILLPELLLQRLEIIASKVLYAIEEFEFGAGQLFM